MIKQSTSPLIRTEFVAHKCDRKTLRKIIKIVSKRRTGQEIVPNVPMVRKESTASRCAQTKWIGTENPSKGQQLCSEISDTRWHRRAFENESENVKTLNVRLIQTTEDVWSAWRFKCLGFSQFPFGQLYFPLPQPTEVSVVGRKGTTTTESLPPNADGEWPIHKHLNESSLKQVLRTGQDTDEEKHSGFLWACEQSKEARVCDAQGKGFVTKKISFCCKCPKTFSFSFFLTQTKNTTNIVFSFDFHLLLAWLPFPRRGHSTHVWVENKWNENVRFCFLFAWVFVCRWATGCNFCLCKLVCVWQPTPCEPLFEAASFQQPAWTVGAIGNQCGAFARKHPFVRLLQRVVQSPALLLSYAVLLRCVQVCSWFCSQQRYEYCKMRVFFFACLCPFTHDNHSHFLLMPQQRSWETTRLVARRKWNGSFQSKFSSPCRLLHAHVTHNDKYLARRFCWIGIWPRDVFSFWDPSLCTLCFCSWTSDIFTDIFPVRMTAVYEQESRPELCVQCRSS